MPTIYLTKKRYYHSSRTRMNNFGFPIDEFKRWMKDHSTDQEDVFDKPKSGKKFVGTVVESKVGLRKLLTKMQPESGKLDELAIDFMNDNGTITDVDDRVFLIEVSSGDFYIERHYVRRA